MSSNSTVQTIRRAKLCDRLNLAAGVLDHRNEADLAQSVRDAICIIKSLPFDFDINSVIPPKENT